MMLSMMLALHLPSFTQQPQVESKRIDVRPWTVVVSRDHFTGAVKCLVKGRHLTIQDAVAVFDLGPHADTSSAAYRLDRGPARSDRDSLPASLDGALVDRTPLDNPSDGLVAVSLTSLAGVSHVDIRANAKTAPVGFDMKGLEAALKVEAAQGCASPGGALALLQPQDRQTAPAHP